MITATTPVAPLLTYEAYLEEGVVEGRYDIVDGVRKTMPGPSWEHQKVSFRLAKQLDSYQEATRRGEVLLAPFDVLIRRKPRLRTRQPDAFFISNAQLARGGGIPTKGFLEVAPELVAEIISDSETEARFADKIRDYIEIGVLECWRIWLESRTVEVLRLSPDGWEVAATYDVTQSAQSLVFPDLIVPVQALFVME